MKKIILLLALPIVVCIACSKKNGTIENTNESAEELTLKFINGEAYLVDVRNPEEYREGHLKYAVNVNFKSKDFKTKISKLDKSKPVYLYCGKGKRAKKAADTLETLGFTKAYNIGGFKDLKEEGLVVEE